MQTSKNFLPTSIPAHRSTLTSSMALSLRREANAFFFRLASRALLAPIGGSLASARPIYLTGFSPKTTNGLLSSSPNLVAFKPFSSRFSFSSSEVARRAMNVYLARSGARWVCRNQRIVQWVVLDLIRLTNSAMQGRNSDRVPTRA